MDSFLTILRPRTLDDALAARVAHPEATIVAGGTGVLVELNRGAIDPPTLIDLSACADLRATAREGDVVVLGATTTYTDVLERHADTLPGLAAAARTVASRQIRNRATLAGALVLGDPSSDALAALGAAGATVDVASATARRTIDAVAFVTAPGRCALAHDELVVALRVPVADGPVAYAKAGARNAMARAVCGVAVALHPRRRRASACAVGVAPTAIRPEVAEALIAADWDVLAAPETAKRFGALVAAAVDPIADARGSAEYRRHVTGVLARRALTRAVEGLDAA
ncbi:Carbon monoxide dehydrogenase medium chain [Baekduia alba]|uniref:FAD binding domain-containing protein n=1 Tax=Baekduia alba TaxID=2997333 RepID=UPI0023423BE1|nr:FAD binding domain-containing protein [Baekduia alba]WCB94593.1 Carbon monoxide dehydrogenase medium chain [Baekduia alba]